MDLSATNGILPRFRELRLHLAKGFVLASSLCFLSGCSSEEQNLSPRALVEAEMDEAEERILQARREYERQHLAAKKSSTRRRGR